jgi:CHASE2 domain-containing sensor protein
VSHFLLMTLYAALLGVFFATLWKRERRAQLVLFAKIFGSLVGGAILLGWLMYFFPSGPPKPFP